MPSPESTINLGGSAITVEMLEVIIETASRYGEVIVVNVGETSQMKLAMELVAVYDKKKDG